MSSFTGWISFDASGDMVVVSEQGVTVSPTVPLDPDEVRAIMDRLSTGETYTMDIPPFGDPP